MSLLWLLPQQLLLRGNCWTAECMVTESLISAPTTAQQHDRVMSRPAPPYSCEQKRPQPAHPKEPPSNRSSSYIFMRSLSLTVTGLIKMEGNKRNHRGTNAISRVIKGRKQASFVMTNSPYLILLAGKAQEEAQRRGLQKRHHLGPPGNALSEPLPALCMSATWEWKEGEVSVQCVSKSSHPTWRRMPLHSVLPTIAPIKALEVPTSAPRLGCGYWRLAPGSLHLVLSTLDPAALALVS